MKSKSETRVEQAVGGRSRRLASVGTSARVSQVLELTNRSRRSCFFLTPTIMSDPAYRTRSRTSLEQVELQNVATTPASIVEDEDEPSYPPSTTATERPLVSLPEPDRGRAAYQFLFAAFVVETLVWGLPSA